MRVAFLITRSDTLGGAQTHIKNLAIGLRQLGVEATILVGGHGPFIDMLAQSHLPYVIVPHLKRSVDPIADVQALVEICGSLKRLRPDLLSAHSSKAGLLGRLAGRALGIPTVFT